MSLKPEGKGAMDLKQASILLQRILSQPSVVFANRGEKKHLKQQLTQQAAVPFLIEIS